MRLYFSPFACSLAAHIACREAGLEVELVRMDLGTKVTEGGGDLREVNPMGQVPTLVTDEGRVLTENAAVLSWIGDRVPDRGLTPAPASDARYELTRWLSLIGNEIHRRGLALRFDPEANAAVKEYALPALARALGYAERHLASRAFLVGETFTVADAYLFWALTIAPHGGVSLDEHPNLRAYQERLLARPAIRAALKQERAELARPFGSGVTAA